MDTSYPPSTPKRSEKDEKAISEIYKTLVTSFHPGKHLSFFNKYTFSIRLIYFCQRIFSFNKKYDFNLKIRKRVDHSIHYLNIQNIHYSCLI
jgi:hypothetical protein